jgi:hypothetical protein
MGHMNSSIYEKSYRNQIIDADIVSAFLETPSDEAIMKLMGHMFLTRDPNAPAEPTSHSAARYKLMSRLSRRKDWLILVAAAKRKAQEDLTVQPELNENTRLKKNHDSLFKRKLTSLFEASRQEYFATIGAACLENQHTGQEEPAGPSLPIFLVNGKTYIRPSLGNRDAP